MVFESVVVDVLNRFLGDYVVNLDTSQLTLGIWGGNETVAVPRSCLPPGLSLRERGPTFLGLREAPRLARRRHLPPPSGVKLRKAGRQFPAFSHEMFIFWQERKGSWVLGGKALFFSSPVDEGPAVGWSLWVRSSDSSPRGPAAAELGEGRQPGAPVRGSYPCHPPLGLCRRARECRTPPRT